MRRAGANPTRESLRKALESQVTKPYFPGGPDALGARREFREIEGGADFQIGRTRVRTCWLNHPQECLTFRLDSSAGSVVYATDHEPVLDPIGDVTSGEARHYPRDMAPFSAIAEPSAEKPPGRVKPDPPAFVQFPGTRED